MEKKSLKEKFREFIHLRKKLRPRIRNLSRKKYVKFSAIIFLKAGLLGLIATLITLIIWLIAIFIFARIDRNIYKWEGFLMAIYMIIFLTGNIIALLTFLPPEKIIKILEDIEKAE